MFYMKGNKAKMKVYVTDICETLTWAVELSLMKESPFQTDVTGNQLWALRIIDVCLSSECITSKREL